ncbi:MAG: hypothetical protein SFZ03_06770 [Candidatus Melainabacteria bacterium]|nr:hypothetical protein [Candidatus Melainabacteria bacterium]
MSHRQAIQSGPLLASVANQAPMAVSGGDSAVAMRYFEQSLNHLAVLVGEELKHFQENQAKALSAADAATGLTTTSTTDCVQKPIGSLPLAPGAFTGVFPGAAVRKPLPSRVPAVRQKLGSSQVSSQVQAAGQTPVAPTPTTQPLRPPISLEDLGEAWPERLDSAAPVAESLFCQPSCVGSQEPIKPNRLSIQPIQPLAALVGKSKQSPLATSRPAGWSQRVQSFFQQWRQQVEQLGQWSLATTPTGSDPWEHLPQDAVWQPPTDAVAAINNVDVFDDNEATAPGLPPLDDSRKSVASAQSVPHAPVLEQPTRVERPDPQRHRVVQSGLDDIFPEPVCGIFSEEEQSRIMREQQREQPYKTLVVTSPSLKQQQGIAPRGKAIFNHTQDICLSSEDSPMPEVNVQVRFLADRTRFLSQSINSLCDMYFEQQADEYDGLDTLSV